MKYSRFITLLIACYLSLSGLAQATPVLTLEPLTWNIVGLDSNNPSSGPNRFPVGARICNTGTTPALGVTADFVWDDGQGVFVSSPGADTYINLRDGSLDFVTLGDLAVSECKDAYFEAEVNRLATAYDNTRSYHITATTSDLSVTGSTPQPRELYVEYLISQSRNSIDDVILDGVSIPAGGSMTLLVGNTYDIDLAGSTATQGYNQFEAFVNFPNTIFQINSVTTTYSADNSPYVAGDPLVLPYDGTDMLYADACLWENDPNSPNYLSCVGGDYKSGGTMTTTYNVTILSGGGSNETLNTLLYDFSGSSFHYNADYDVGSRFAAIVDPTNVNIVKSFNPNPTNVNGVSSLTITLSNPNPATVTGYNFVDPLPANLVVATPPDASTTSCGSPTLTAVAGATSISFVNGTIAANSSCTIKVNVTPANTGTYTNVTNNVFIDSLDSGQSATADLTVNTTPPPPPPPSVCTVPSTLATWTMPAAGQGSGGPPPPYTIKAADVATATTSYTTVSGVQNISTTVGNPVNAWGGTAPTAGDGWNETATSMNNYFQFSLDTSEYGGVYVTFDIRPDNPGDWASPNSNIFINTSADGGAYTPYTPVPQAAKNAWVTRTTNSVPTGSATTSFRFGIDGSGNNKTGATVYLDNVIFMGCPRLDPPEITKTFGTNPIAINGVSTLTFTLTNPNASNALNGVSFLDSLPTGLQVAATPNASTTCGGTPTWSPSAGATLLTFGSPAGASIPLSSSCTVSVDVTATASGAFQNVTEFITSTNGGTNYGATGIASASLIALEPPSIAKMFAPNPILPGEMSTLTFTIINPNQNGMLVGLAFTDTFPVAPGAMTVAAPLTTTNTCGGILENDSGGALAAGDAGIRLTGGMVPGGNTCSVTVNVTALTVGSYANTSGAISSNNGGTGNTASDTLTVNPPNPAISTLKQISTNALGPWTSFVAVSTGTNVFYKFTVQNDGDVPLSSVNVTDPLVSTAGCAWQNGDGGPLVAPFVLSVAAATNNQHYATCVTGAVATVAGSHLNTATASGTYSGTTYTDTSSAIYATTGITLAKSVTESFFTAAGDLLHYSYLVSNTGFAPLVGPVTVADDIVAVTCPAVTTVGDLDNYLEPGESITCTATYTVLASDVIAQSITNTATATVDGVASASDSVTVNLASLGVNKPAPVNGDGDGSGTVTLGDVLTYTITATNTGTATLTNVVVGDSLITPTGGTTPCASVAPGGTCTLIGTYTVVQSDVDAGVINNTGTADSDETAQVTEGESTPVPQNPVIDVVKSSTTANVTTAGQVVPYSFSVSNAGNVSLTNISVVDGMCDAAPGYQSGDDGDGILQTTETWLYSCDHTVTTIQLRRARLMPVVT